MRTAAWTNASNGLGKYFLGLFFSTGLTAGIDLGKIHGQPCDDFIPAFSRERRRLNGANADLFIFEHTPAKQALDGGFLVRRQIFSAADHGKRP
jgi:hypothetical protein